MCALVWVFISGLKLDLPLVGLAGVFYMHTSRTCLYTLNIFFPFSAIFALEYPFVIISDIALHFNLEHNQSADRTTWTRFLIIFNYYSWYCVNANQLPTPTFYYMHDCQDLLIQSSTSRVFVSIPIPWIYSSLLRTKKRFNKHRYSPTALSVLWY